MLQFRDTQDTQIHYSLHVMTNDEKESHEFEIKQEQIDIRET